MKLPKLTKPNLAKLSARRTLRTLCCAFGILVFVLVGFWSFEIYLEGLARPQPKPLTPEEQQTLETVRGQLFPRQLVSPLPYRLAPPDFDLTALSAIVIDAANGSILYEKNADQRIPPASLTKLAVMYALFQDIASGKSSPDDVVPLPPETWAKNAPPGSSLMFLGEGQRVTLREVLLGLAVSSGNDAAVAAALFSAGSVEAFCVKMNGQMARLGLTQTRFVEPSGYSELNTTTAREFAAFSRQYVSVFPQALPEYHARRSFAYPTADNYPAGWPGGNPIEQAAKNTALGVIDGCDGLKTGYIDESGYNLAMTVQRDGMRFISVTLNGPGRSSYEGNAYRLQDARRISDWVFSSFYTRPGEIFPPQPLTILGGRQTSLCLIPAYIEALTVPTMTPGETAKETAERLEVVPQFPKYIKAPIAPGEQIGVLNYQADGIILAQVPLIADRAVPQGNPFKKLLDVCAEPFLR